MAGVRNSINVIDLTAEFTDDEDELLPTPNHAAARARLELSSKWQPRAQPANGNLANEQVVKTLFRPSKQETDESFEDNEDAFVRGNTSNELQKWLARPQREASMERKAASSVSDFAKKAQGQRKIANSPLIAPRPKTTRREDLQHSDKWKNQDALDRPSFSTTSTLNSSSARRLEDLQHSNIRTTRPNHDILDFPDLTASTDRPSLKRYVNGELKLANGARFLHPRSVHHTPAATSSAKLSVSEPLALEPKSSPADDRRSRMGSFKINRVPGTAHPLSQHSHVLTHNNSHQKDGSQASGRLLSSRPTTFGSNGTALVPRDVTVQSKASSILQNNVAIRTATPKSGVNLERPAMTIQRPSPTEMTTLTNNNVRPLPEVMPNGGPRSGQAGSKDDEHISKLILNVLVATGDNGVVATAYEAVRLSSLVKSVSQLPNMHGQPFTTEEDVLLIFLKERANMKWPQMEDYFPGRSTWHAMQTRYSKCLQPKVRESFSAYAKASPSNHSGPQSRPRRSTRLLVSDDEGEEEGEKSFLRNETSSMEIDSDKRPSEESAEDHVSCIAEPRKLSSAVMSHTISNPNLFRISPEGAVARPIARALPPRSVSDRLIRQNTDVDASSIGDRTSIHQRARQLISRDLLTLEKDRDTAALASLTLRIKRQPLVDKIGPSLAHHPSHARIMRRKRRSIDVSRPYLDYSEREFLAAITRSSLWDGEEVSDWEGKVIHVDFLDEELEALENSIRAIYATVRKDGESIRTWAAEALKGATEAQISSASRHMQGHGPFLNRTKSSIDGFLRDVANSSTTGVIPSVQTLRLRPRIVPTSHLTGLQDRELGGRRPFAEWFTSRNSKDLRLAVYNSLGPHLSMTVGSGDVTNVAWSPNGEVFAAGCAALTDEHSMQYNVRNNLLLGDTNTKILRELPEHATARILAPTGANASREMHVSQDPLLFSSISAVQFSPDGTAMFTTGYDNVARVWDVRKDRDRNNSIDDAACVLEFQHRAAIDLLAVNAGGLFATGSQRNTSSIKVMKYDLETTKPRALKKLSLSSPRAEQRPDLDIIPSCMRWGYNIQQNYLLCGFSSRAQEGNGETCIWDVAVGQPTAIARGSRNVFDVAWSPTIFGRFAVGSTPRDSKQVNRGTESVVRLYDSRLLASLRVNPYHTIELECPAYDINDVVFNPSDENLISTGCTDGTVYIWDLRNPDYLLHRLVHGTSLTPLDESRPHEETDTGIRFLSWDQSRRNLYAGSSDGVVALWNPYLNTADAHIRDVVQLNSGVMSGAFSPDFSNLLLGEVNGTVSLLSVGNQDKTTKDFEPFQLQPADEDTLNKVRRRVGAKTASDNGYPKTIGTDTARSLVASGEMEIRPFGDMPVRQAVQGPRYAGPFDSAEDAAVLRTKTKEFQERMRPSVKPCTVDHDRHEPKITEEERGDSHAWVMRIPERLRASGGIGGDEVRSTAVPGMPSGLMCFRCHTHPLDTFSFQSLETDMRDDVVSCPVCERTWLAGVLGYTLLGGKGGVRGNVETDLTVGEKEHDSEAELADVMAWHQSFWKDRSPSPL